MIRGVGLGDRFLPVLLLPLAQALRSIGDGKFLSLALGDFVAVAADPRRQSVPVYALPVPARASTIPLTRDSAMMRTSSRMLAIPSSNPGISPVMSACRPKPSTVAIVLSLNPLLRNNRFWAMAAFLVVRRSDANTNFGDTIHEADFDLIIILYAE